MKILLLVCTLATSCAIKSMSYNQVNSIPPSKKITVDWDITDDFYATNYQGTARDVNSNEAGVIVISIEKPSWIEFCLGKKTRQAQIRHLVINVLYKENLIRAAQLKIAENQDIDELAISLRQNDHDAVYLYLDMEFQEEKPIIQKPTTLTGKLISLVQDKLGLRQEEPSRRKFVYNFFKHLKEY